MIIYGTSTYFRAKKVTQHGFCTHCKNFAKFKSFNGSPFFHLYFIPVIPIGSRKRNHKICSKCDTGQAFDPKVFEEIIKKLKDQSADAIVALKNGEATFDTDDVSEDQIECVPFLQNVIDWIYASSNADFCEGMLAQLTEPECRYAQAMLRAEFDTLRGRVDDALNSYREASQLKPDDYKPHQLRGKLFATKKATNDSISSYKDAIALAKPEIDFMLRLELVDIQTDAKQYADAAKNFDWLLEADPSLLNNKNFMKLVNKNKKKAGIT